MPSLRRHSLLSLYEEAVVNDQLAYAPLDDDDDSPYDVFLFWPSTAPHVLVPEDFLQDNVHETSLPTVYAQPFQHSIEIAHTALTAPFDDPTLDEDFMDNDAVVVMDVAGYSRLFTAGLAQTSREVTQQLGGVVRSLRRAFSWPRWLS